MMWNLPGRYEAWVVSAAIRPTVLTFVVVFALLAIVTFAAYRRSPRSLRAAAWFWVVNLCAWSYLNWAAELSPAWERHVRFALIHAILGAGGWLIVALVGKFFLGWEDRPPGEDVVIGQFYDRRSVPRYRPWRKGGR